MSENKSTGKKPGHNSSDHGFVETPTVIPTAPTPQKPIIRSSGIVSSHPSFANQATDTIPWPQRYANFGDASRELKLAKDALAIARGKYGVDGVAPGMCANCGHPHHLSRPLKLNLGDYSTTSVCGESTPSYNNRFGTCLCHESTLANAAQSAMYLAEQMVSGSKAKYEAAKKEVAEPQPSDTYYVVKGLRNRNMVGWVVLTKSEGDNTKVLLEFKDVNGKSTSQKWFPLKKLKRSLVHLGLI